MRFPRSVAALGLAAIFIVAACGSSTSSPSGSASGSPRASGSGGSGTPRPTTAAGATPVVTDSQAPTERTPIASVSPDQLIFADRLLICSDIPYPPMEFFDDEGNPIGFDIDMGREIAARLGLELVVVNSVFDSIISAVNGGKCDIILSSMNITADRKKQIDFITYFQAGQAFVVAKDNPENIHTQEDLCGKSVAAESGTTEVDYLQGTSDYEGQGLSAACEAAGLEPIDIQTFQKDSDALLALQGGQVSSYFADSPVAGFYVQQHPESFELSGLALDVIKQGIGVPKEKPDLQAQVRRALSSMVRDGTYLSLLEQWGLQDGNVFS